MKEGITLQPGETISGSFAIPDINSSRCYNPDCHHYLGWSSYGMDVVDGSLRMSPSVKDPQCAHCGWTADGPSDDPKWKKKLWPSLYAIELRERLHGPNKPAIGNIPNDNWWGHIYNALLGWPKRLVCEHEWIGTGEAWFEDFHGHYRPDTHCENVVCDKCGTLSVKREKNMYTYVGGGWNRFPAQYRIGCLPVPVKKHPEFTTQAEVKAALVVDDDF